jgi:hypothetical protein
MSRKDPINPRTIFGLAGDLSQWPTLDYWLARPLSREHAKGLSPEAKAARQRARVRLAHRKAKFKAALSRLEAPTPMRGGILRDILHLEPVILHPTTLLRAPNQR